MGIIKIIKIILDKLNDKFKFLSTNIIIEIPNINFNNQIEFHFFRELGKKVLNILYILTEKLKNSRKLYK